MVKKKVKKKQKAKVIRKVSKVKQEKHSRAASGKDKHSKVAKLKRLASQRRAHSSKKKGILHRIFKR